MHTAVLQKIPVTISLVSLCILVFIAQGFVAIDEYGALSAHAIVQRFQLWRALTYCFMHANILHILMNMVALGQLGYLLEPMLGSGMFLTCSATLNAISVALYCVFCYFGDYVLPNSMALHLTGVSVVGMSSILFGLMAIESLRAERQVVPWVILIVIQFGMHQQVSFVGHVSGILSGYLYHYWHRHYDEDYRLLTEYLTLPQ